MKFLKTIPKQEIKLNVKKNLCSRLTIRETALGHDIIGFPKKWYPWQRDTTMSVRLTIHDNVTQL